ncbi:MAG: sensor histidine kinase [Phenylobacterium sp.]|uniref:sensor histidine kinase n=1 Tax=Phenylobacterium sp. TaxID=1871053 RepID=UPI00391974AD
MPQAVHVAPPVESDDTDRRRRAGERRAAVLDERMRSFLRMVSHELRTPLNSILGFSEIIASELCGPLGAPQYKEYAGIIRSSGQRLLKLVNQVLEIARLEGRAADLDLSPEPLDHALDDALDGLREDIAANAVRIVVSDRGALPSVMADARGLRTVLSNLIHNAVIFGPDGGEVRIEAQVEDGFVDVAVIDQGEGIDPDDAPRLLRPFEQGENALVRRAEGAGLGLPIVDLLCQAMGGRLRLENGEHGGLKAVARLPAA